MIIRRSEAADLSSLQTLWQEIFGDPPAFTGQFYRTFGADSAIVAEKEGKIVAMIHPLPVALAQNGQYFFGVYLYALATHPHHRGQGIAARLLEEAEKAPFLTPPSLDAASLRSVVPSATPAFSLLIPGEDSLIAYYQSKGYTQIAHVISQEAKDYPAQLRQGAGDRPIFLKPYHFFEFSRKMPEAVPPPAERGLWKPLTDHLPKGEPTLSHFMQ